MSLRTASQPKTWGTSAVTTLVVLAATAIGVLAGTALAWMAVTHNPHVTAQTVVEAAIVVDLACMAEAARRLLRSYRGPR